MPLAGPGRGPANRRGSLGIGRGGAHAFGGVRRYFAGAGPLTVHSTHLHITPTRSLAPPACMLLPQNVHSLATYIIIIMRCPLEIFKYTRGPLLAGPLNSSGGLCRGRLPPADERRGVPGRIPKTTKSHAISPTGAIPPISQWGPADSSASPRCSLAGAARPHSENDQVPPPIIAENDKVKIVRPGSATFPSRTKTCCMCVAYPPLHTKCGCVICRWIHKREGREGGERALRGGVEPAGDT